MVDQYNLSGISVTQVEMLPHGVVSLSEEGEISVRLPPIGPYGNDGVAVHELTHVEQIINGLTNLTPEEIGNNPHHNKALAEIGALETQLTYFRQFPRPLLKAPAYQEAIRQVEERLNSEKQKLPEGLAINSGDKLDPYKKIIDL